MPTALTRLGCCLSELSCENHYIFNDARTKHVSNQFEFAKKFNMKPQTQGGIVVLRVTVEEYSYFFC